MQKVKIRNLIGAASTAGFAMMFQSAQAETTRMHFDVTILGLKAGELRYTLQKDDTSYAASGLLYPTGLAATMTTFLYDVTVTGSHKGDQYLPSRYSEKSEFLSPQINGTTTGNFYLLVLGDVNGTGLN